MYLVQLFSLFFVARGQDLITSRFITEDVLCDLPARLTSGCSSQIPKSRGLIKCMSICGRNNSCIGASIDEFGHCFIHENCPSLAGCVVPNSDHHYMTKFCVNGTWDSVNRTCKCVKGFIGERCNRTYSVCKDLILAGYPEGTHEVYLDPEQKGKPFRVTCYVAPLLDYTLTYLAQNEGFEDFNKTWEEYVYGFHTDETHFWAGLDAWNRLSDAGLNYLSLSLGVFFGNDQAYPFDRWYPGFHLSGENTGFRFTFERTGFSGGYLDSDFGDCLGDLQNVSFSAWNADHDQNQTENCAARAGSGWWYTGCDNPCNLLGFELYDRVTKPPYQLFSVLGVDLEQNVPPQIVFTMQLDDYF